MAKSINSINEFIQQLHKVKLDMGGDTSNFDDNHTIHDLQTYQIELEMQNEELHRTQLDLEAARDKYKQLYDLAPVGYLTLNSKWCIKDGNFTIANMLGTDRESLVDKPLSSFIISEDQDTFYKHRIAVCSSTSPSSCRLKLCRSDATQIIVQVDSVLINEQGKNGRMCQTVIRDISHEVQLELKLRQSQKLRSVEILTRGVAHEFNNSLSMILGSAELGLEHDSPEPKIKKRLETIVDAAKEASQVVKKLYWFCSQPEKDDLYISLVPLVNEVLPLIHSMTPDNVEIQIDIPKKTSCVKINFIQIQQLMINLCTNAFHAMEEKGSCLSIRLDEYKLMKNLVTAQGNLKPGEYIRLNISDNGIGILEKNLDKIFDPFFTTKNMEEGSGLGLAVVHGIMEQLDGGIVVETKPGIGSSFQLLFPELKPTL
jgi:two-component system, cell cycle sensor histidine kinase and response regulator CckA